jgi:hypothetical protein
VVYGFNANQLGDQRWVVGVDVFDQVQLGLRGADDQDFLGTSKGLRHAVVIVFVFGCAAIA